jgi:alpha-beta hydrolase superfamily lysophospholipase
MRKRLLAAVITVLALSAPAVASASDGSSCPMYRVPVHLSPGDSTVWHVAGWLCGPAKNGGTVQILSPGGWYSHSYFDWPQDPGRYSYVRTLAAAGYATFNIDRIGIGQSDHPPAVLVNLPSEAFIAHQLVQDLRAGAIGGGAGAFGGTHFGKVILVGHSFGSFLSVFEAATYHDVDGLILTGALVTPGSGYARLFSSLYPAQLDPRFATAGLPLGYVTTLPGTRGGLFYDLQAADPTVIALDEATKETATAGEAASFYQWEALTRLVHTPVLSAVGDHDRFFCDIQCGTPLSATSLEPAYWSPDACLELFVLPHAGHDIDLHPNAPTFFAAATDWSNRRVGRSAAAAPSQPCGAGAAGASTAPSRERPNRSTNHNR